MPSDSPTSIILKDLKSFLNISIYHSGQANAFFNFLQWHFTALKAVCITFMELSWSLFLCHETGNLFWLTWLLLSFGHVLHCLKPPLHLAEVLEPHQCSGSAYVIYDMEDLKAGAHFPGYCHSLKKEAAGDLCPPKPCFKAWPNPGIGLPSHFIFWCLEVVKPFKMSIKINYFLFRISTERTGKICKQKTIKLRVKSQTHDFVHWAPVSSPLGGPGATGSIIVSFQIGSHCDIQLEISIH